jgi:hypothetical protein
LVCGLSFILFVDRSIKSVNEKESAEFFKDYINTLDRLFAPTDIITSIKKLQDIKKDWANRSLKNPDNTN